MNGETYYIAKNEKGNWTQYFTHSDTKEVWWKNRIYGIKTQTPWVWNTIGGWRSKHFFTDEEKQALREAMAA